MNVVLAAIAFLALALPGCTSSEPGTRPQSRTLIVQEDIRNAGTVYRSAYEVIQSLQPTWLRKRGNRIMNDQNETMEGDIVVYLNGTRMGGPDALRDIVPDSIAQIEFLDAARAVRLGTGHQHGAIMVQTL
jgi:hypothetical protein